MPDDLRLRRRVVVFLLVALAPFLALERVLLRALLRVLFLAVFLFLVERDFVPALFFLLVTMIFFPP